jgi:N-acetylglucosamine repressor
MERNYQSNSSPIKLQNIGTILDIVRKEGAIARNSVAEIANISTATVSRIVDTLISDGILIEAGMGECTGGRRPVMLEINSKKGYIIGIDAGIDSVVGVLTDLSSSVVASCTKWVDAGAYSTSLVESIEACVQDLVDKAHSFGKRVFEIGLGVRGVIETLDDNVILYSSGFPGCSSLSIDIAKLNRKFGIPVNVENYLRAYSLVQTVFGAAKGIKRFAYLYVDEMIGGCLMIQEKGSEEFVEEFNQIQHMIVSREGPQCKCGGYGCLDVMVGSERVINMLHEKVRTTSGSMLTGILETGELSDREILTELCVAAELGDRLCQEIVEEMLIYISIAIANMINLARVDTILLSGYLVESGDWIAQELKDKVVERVIMPYRRNLTIIPVKIGKMTGALGASISALRSIYSKDVESQLSMFLEDAV